MVGNNLNKMKLKICGKGLEGGDTCLLGISGKCTVKAYVHVPEKGKKYEFSAPEPVRKDGKEDRICLLEGEKISVKTIASCNSIGVEKSGESHHHPIWT